MKCYNCEEKLAKKEEKFGLCGDCEKTRSEKQLDELQEENAQEEMKQANNKDWQKEFSRSGGLKKSEKKTEQCRKNARQPRGRWVTAMRFQVRCKQDNGYYDTMDGVLLSTRGKDVGNLSKNNDKIIAMIEARVGCPVTELLEFETVGEKI